MEWCIAWFSFHRFLEVLIHQIPNSDLSFLPFHQSNSSSGRSFSYKSWISGTFYCITSGFHIFFKALKVFIWWLDSHEVCCSLKIRRSRLHTLVIILQCRTLICAHVSNKRTPEEWALISMRRSASINLDVSVRYVQCFLYEVTWRIVRLPLVI